MSHLWLHGFATWFYAHPSHGISQHDHHPDGKTTYVPGKIQAAHKLGNGLQGSPRSPGAPACFVIGRPSRLEDSSIRAACRKDGQGWDNFSKIFSRD